MNSLVPLTPKQKRLWQYLQEFVQNQGYWPSRREMATAMGVSSVATIQEQVEILKEKGWLVSESADQAGKARQLEFAQNVTIETQVPCLGKIAAGFPIEVFSEPSEMLSIPLSMIVSKRPHYALQVQGFSMIDQGILEGDWVILEKRSHARSKEVVAALWKGEATLKTYIESRDGIELHPANPSFPIMRVGARDDFQIQGILTGVLRWVGRSK